MPDDALALGPRITTLAFNAAHTARRSSAASAWHSEPPIVPRLRTTGSAITSSASREHRRPLRQQLGVQQLRVARQRADPDLVAFLADVGELVQIVDVDQVLGAARRSFIIGSRLCPPAMIRASPSCSHQRRDRALDAGRPLVLKRRRSLHRASFLRSRRPASACGRRATRCGSYCTGESVR